MRIGGAGKWHFFSRVSQICWRTVVKKYRHGGGGYQNSRKNADVFYGWSQLFVFRLFVRIESSNYLWNLRITSVIILIIGVVITRQLTNCKPDDKLSSSASAKEAFSVSVLHPFISCAELISSCQLSLFFWPPHRTCLFIFQLDMDNFLQIVLPVNLLPFPKIWHVFLLYALSYEFLLFFTTLVSFFCWTFVRKK